MSDILDPLANFFVIMGVLVVLAVVVGLFLPDTLGIVGTVVFLGLFGFLSGHYMESNEGEWFGFLLASGVLAAIISYFLPLSMPIDLAIFVVGYVIGMETERREGHVDEWH